MNTYKVLNLFAEQLERAIEEKVVITPSSVNEKGVVVKVSLLKTFLQFMPKGTFATRTMRVRVSVCGTAESLEGLNLATSAIEKLDAYLLVADKGTRLTYLENDEEKIIANTRIVTVISEEDSFIDSPDSIAVQDVQDDRICTISFPVEVMTNEE